ncbi:EamA-like transporter family protein [Cognatiyoonia sediminum]|uniref:EamA-like transporter family protein n=1 Tax=Cognatiyoonia sediminum TaxID=1508389 RepID=A0A1M5NAG4_9RHOB|nr:EamA family transporter [Cognatiyoonia sediminum]SHG86510.1 EamA-like transporter family protein [Cognatiyoonia sediminum]
MEAWVWITVMAAAAQTVRFMLQKHLKATKLSTTGATFARFIYSAPLVLVIALSYAGVTEQGLPSFNGRFFMFAVIGGLSQILATMCVVALFAHRNFAVGITFKKTEVLLSAIVGIVVLGDFIDWMSFLAILLGFAGVLLLSDPPNAVGSFGSRVFNKGAGLGLLSGLFFGFSGVSYRGASLSIAEGDVFFRAIFTLAFVTAFQVAIMAVWLVWRERGEIMRVLRAWRIASLVGLTSMAGSICWFTAFTMQTAALVNAVGQIELIFSLAASALFFREKVTSRELQGLGLLTLSILALILIG